jgi:hypothetical protein
MDPDVRKAGMIVLVLLSAIVAYQRATVHKTTGSFLTGYQSHPEVDYFKLLLEWFSMISLGSSLGYSFCG